MFCFVIADRYTGEIVHCFMDNGEDVGFRERMTDMISKGEPPIVMLNMPENLFYAVLDEDDLVDALSSETVTRFSNTKKDIATEMHKATDSLFDAVRVREEVRAFPGPEIAKGISRCVVQARAFRCKINEVTGRPVEDMAHYDSIVQADRAREYGGVNR